MQVHIQDFRNITLRLQSIVQEECSYEPQLGHLIILESYLRVDVIIWYSIPDR